MMTFLVLLAATMVGVTIGVVLILLLLARGKRLQGEGYTIEPYLDGRGRKMLLYSSKLSYVDRLALSLRAG